MRPGTTRQAFVGIAAGAVLLAVSLTACEQGIDEHAGAEITIDSSGAYPVIRSAGLADEWQAELLTTIAGDTGVAESFGTVRSVLLDSTGAVYVVDPSYVQVSVFDTTGALRSRLGRKGQGPSEYAMPYSLAWVGDTLALLDPGNSRIGLMSPSGAWHGQFISQRISGPMVRLIRTPPRGFWSMGWRPGTDGTAQSLWIRHSSAGPQDTLVQFRFPEGANEFARCDHPGGGMTFFSPPFGAVPLFLPTASGEQLVARTSEYRIAVLGASLDTLRVIERPVNAAPISDAEWEAEAGEIRDWKVKNPKAHCDRDSWTRPAGKPPIVSMFTDDEQQLWVEVLTAEGRAYDVFGPDGRLRATVTGLPATDGVEPSVVGGRIALAVKGEDDVQAVRVYRIRK